MTTRTFVDKNGNSWEWEETPEVVEALKKINNPEFAGNYSGPLYAPHPELKKPNKLNSDTI